MSINRSNIHKPFLALSLVLTIIGFSELLGPAATGFAKSFGAIFFILFFIATLLKTQKTDDDLRKESSRLRSDATKRPKMHSLKPANA